MNAMDIRKLEEKRNALLEQMENTVKKAVEETRAMTEDEEREYSEMRAQVDSLARTIQTAEENRAATLLESKKTAEGEPTAEERAFLHYLTAGAGGKSVETRAGEQNITMGNNGAVIPTTIANRIVKKINEISPILSRATVFRAPGTLKVPVWGDAGSGHNIKAAWTDEFTEVTADAGKFTSIDLTGYLFASLALIGKSVIYSSTLDVLGFVVDETARTMAEFMEAHAINGESGKFGGALATDTTMSTASASKITTDELIDLQSMVPTAYQNDAVWLMNPKTFAELKKLKDLNGRYLLQDDVTGAFPYRMLGKTVWLSDNMPTVAASAKPILYGDPAGLAIKMGESIEMQLLNEKYATMHALGVIAWGEMDAKVIDHQKLAALVMAES